MWISFRGQSSERTAWILLKPRASSMESLIMVKILLNVTSSRGSVFSYLRMRMNLAHYAPRMVVDAHLTRAHMLLKWTQTAQFLSEIIDLPTQRILTFNSLCLRFVSARPLILLSTLLINALEVVE